MVGFCARCDVSMYGVSRGGGWSTTPAKESLSVLLTGRTSMAYAILVRQKARNEIL